MTRTTIVFGADEGYVEPLLVALASLVRPGGVTADDAQVGVLHPGLPPAAADRVRRVGEALGLDVELFEAEADPDRYPVTDWITAAAYLRLRLAEAARGAAQVLYLDCDLIATGPIGELLATDLDAPVGAVRDVSHPTVGSGEGIPGFERLGIPADRDYLNSGVLLVDLARWRREQVAERCERFLVEHPEHVRFWDQDALNVVLDDGWTRLPPAFNALPLSMFAPTDQVVGGSTGADVEPDPAKVEAYLGPFLAERGYQLEFLPDALAAERGARILHFAGPLKPWRRGFDAPWLAARYQRAAAWLAEVEASTASRCG